MFSILLMATLMDSLTFATHIWAPGANLTDAPANKNVAKRLTANNEGAWLGWVSTYWVINSTPHCLGFQGMFGK